MSHFSKQDDFQINQKLEEQRFLLAEKKMQMIQLQAKIDALGVFNSIGVFNINFQYRL